MVDWTQSPSQDRRAAGLAPEQGQPPLALAHVAPYTLEGLRCVSAVKLTWPELVPMRLFYCEVVDKDTLFVISFFDSVKLPTLLKTANVLGMFSSPRWLDM